MTLDSIAAIRLKSSDKSTITLETSVGDGTSAYWKLKHAPILTTPPIQIRKNNVLLIDAADYTVDTDNGVVTFTVPPVVNDDLDFTYYWSVFSDAEIQFFLDDAGGNVTIATAKLLLAWAADAAKIAKRQTLSGGGGLGQAVIDTSVVAKELRATAKALIDTEKDLGESIPAEGLTEVPWTEQMYHRQLDQHLIRDN